MTTTATFYRPRHAARVRCGVLAPSQIGVVSIVLRLANEGSPAARRASARLSTLGRVDSYVPRHAA